jgi:hypothetical protein
MRHYARIFALDVTDNGEMTRFQEKSKIITYILENRANV